MIIESPSDPNDIPGWLTVVLSLLTGLGGGVAGALIAAKTQRGIARTERRDTAQYALWSYHRILLDWSSEMEARETRESRYTKSDADKLNAARDAAYPFRSYLAKDKQKLVTRNWLPDWFPETGAMGVADGFYAWAKELEEELDRVFGQDER